MTSTRLAKTVSELRRGLLFERTQIPRIDVNVRASQKTMEPLEATRLPGAQGQALKSSRPDQ